MRRAAKRDFGTSYRDERPRSSRPYPHNGNKRQRQSHNGSSYTSLIASRRVDAKDEKSPSLADLKAQLQPNHWLWDRTPPGYEHLNVQVLKLFNVAQQHAKSTPELPEILKNIKNVRELNAENSVVFRALNIGGKEKVFDNLLEASQAVAEHKGQIFRPHRLPNLQTQNVLLDPNALVVSSLVDARERYGEITGSASLSNGAYAVTFANRVEPQAADFYLFTPARQTEPFIEVRNALPLARGESSQALDVLRQLCAEPIKQLIVEDGVVKLTLKNSRRSSDVAQKLGAARVQGRPLVTSICTSFEKTD